MLNGFVCIGILLNVFLYFFELLAPWFFLLKKKWI